jgi:ring-1,2-phenylacetyl-CoA epoxidase subunit PaaB
MIWEVFRQANENAEFTYCRDVHAPDREMAKQFAVIQHGRRKPTHALWVAPQDEIADVAAGDDLGEPASGDPGTWQVFSPDRQGYHTHVGGVEAADEVAAKRAALDKFAEGDENLWVVREELIGEVTVDDVTFGGTTNKAYRFAQTYNVDAAAQEVEASEREQVEAEQRSRGDR